MAGLTRRGFLVAPVVAAAGRAAVAAPRVGCIKLPGGRRIAYAEHGNPAGRTVLLYHHGLPSSRREAEVLLPALPFFPDVRLISFDRSGMGDSDPVACVSFRGWAADLGACADALGLSRFALVGTSGGTPFALAAALAMPERVTRVALACPVAEHQKGKDNGASAWFLKLSRTAPRLAERVLTLGARRVAKDPRAVVRLLPLTDAEKKLFDDPANVALVSGFILDAAKQGPAAPVAESALLPGPWGLPLCKVAVPVFFFHGTCDRLAPPWMSEALGRQIPGAVVRLYPGEGHVSLPNRHPADVVAAAAG